jgi:PEP-CTERM motif-containing protein
MRIARYIAALSMIAMPALSFATVIDDTSNRVPEPETLALLAGAAVAWGIVRWIRRK